MNNIDRTCRVCLSCEKDELKLCLINIFQQSCEPSRFSAVDALLKICDLQVSEADNYPKTICTHCHCRLQDAFDLRLLSLRSQDVLKNTIPGPATLNLKYQGLDLKNDSDTDYKDEECVSIKSEPEIDLCDVFKVEAISLPEVGRDALLQAEICRFCETEFSEKLQLDEHLGTFHLDNLFKCCGCTFQAFDQNELTNHALSHKQTEKNDTDELGFQYECRICFTWFESLEEQQAHVRAPYSRSIAVTTEDSSTVSKPKRRKKANPDASIRSKKTSKRRSKTNKNIPEEPAPSRANPYYGKVPICCGCPKVFSTFEELQNHQKQDHIRQEKSDGCDEMPFECDGCWQRFSAWDMLSSHKLEVITRKLYECSKCTANRQRVGPLLKHLATHDGGADFICCGCRTKFNSLESLQQHSRKEHISRASRFSEAQKQEKPFECTICYRRYKTSISLNIHQRNGCKQREFQCDVCGKGFYQKKILSLHMATHTTEAKYPCTKCGKKFRHEEYARRCMASHDPVPKYRCEHCNILYPDLALYKSHMISHSDARPFSCKICGNTFKRRCHLRDHMVGHLNKDKFQCRYCPTGFRTSSMRLKHEVKHTGAFPYQCEVCGKKLMTRLIYIRHHEAHMEESAKVFKCHICDVRYSKDHFLSNHIKFTHRIEPQDVDWNSKFDRVYQSIPKNSWRKQIGQTESAPNEVPYDQIQVLGDVDEVLEAAENM